MTKLFKKLQKWSFAQKAALLFLYGLVTFMGIYLVGNLLFDNVIIFRIFEFLWFVHIVIICNQLQRSQKEYVALAVIALSPGILNNVLGVLAL